MCPLGTSDYITFWFTKKFVIPVVNKAIVVCLNEIHFFHIKSLDLNSTQLVHDLNTNLSLMLLCQPHNVVNITLNRLQCFIWDKLEGILDKKGTIKSEPYPHKTESRNLGILVS